MHHFFEGGTHQRPNIGIGIHCDAVERISDQKWIGVVEGRGDSDFLLFCGLHR